MNPRDLLIALNSNERIQRDALCRLATAPERWAHLGSTGALTPRAAAQHAAALDVTPLQLSRALETLPGAERRAATERQRAKRAGGRIVCRGDADYPPQLLDLTLPPPVLTIRGQLPTRPAVAIVGSREMSGYGEEAARRFATGLAAAGVTVVSGFARGVDTIAHQAALAAGGKTIAVLGCGIDIDYPRGNARLADDIARHGAVVSEFSVGAEPRSWRFPIRNRVIAALALGTLVVEATVKSGSLITAHQALDLGRDVYAVPGSIFEPRAAGTNNLIADGALVARDPQDILESLSLGVQQELFPAPRAKPPLSPPASNKPAATQSPSTQPTTTQATTTHPTSTHPSMVPSGPPPAGTAGNILAILIPDRGCTVEEIAGRASTPVDEVLGALLELELGGWVQRAPGPVYLRV